MSKKILILSKQPKSYSTMELVKEAKKQDFDPEVVSPYDLYAFISEQESGYDRIYKKGETSNTKLIKKDYAAIIPRIVGGSSFDYDCMIVQHLSENLKIFSTASEFGLQVSSNKFKNAQFLSRLKLKVAKQVLAHQPIDYAEIIERVGDLPCVGKLQVGSQGNGVFILNDDLAATTSLESFGSSGNDIVLQRFINAGDKKSDIRVFIIGPETKEPKLYAYRRFASAGDFRSNYSKSHQGEQVELTEKEYEISIKAAKALKLGVCGLDIMHDVDNENEPYIIETNGCPGLEGVTKITGVNIANEIISYISDNYKKGSSFITGMKDEFSVNASVTDTVPKLEVIEVLQFLKQELLKEPKFIEKECKSVSDQIMYSRLLRETRLKQINNFLKDYM